MEENEARVFKIAGRAIDELMWELLNKTGEQCLGLPEDSDTVFHMKWDKEKDERVFYALEFGHPRWVDFTAIDRYIDAHIGITADSLFDPGSKRFAAFITDDAGL